MQPTCLGRSLNLFSFDHLNLFSIRFLSNLNAGLRDSPSLFSSAQSRRIIRGLSIRLYTHIGARNVLVDHYTVQYTRFFRSHHRVPYQHEHYFFVTDCAGVAREGDRSVHGRHAHVPATVSWTATVVVIGDDRIVAALRYRFPGVPLPIPLFFPHFQTLGCSRSQSSIAVAKRKCIGILPFDQ